MKLALVVSLGALALTVLAGCPEKKPEGDGPASAKAPPSSAPANAPTPPANAKPAGGW